MLLLEILQNIQENTWAGVSFLIKLQAACSFIKIEFPTQVFSCKSCEIFRDFSRIEVMRRTGEKKPQRSSIKLSGSFLKVLLEHYLKYIKLCHYDKNHQLNHKKGEIRKRKVTKPTQKDFELLSFFKTSSEKELLNDNDLLT